MKKIIISIVAVAALVALPMSVKAQEGATENVSTGATIISPIELSHIGTLEFGTLTNGTAGDVTISPEGERSSDDVKIVGTNGAVPTFTITGGPGLAFTITLPENDVVTIDDGEGTGGEPMAVNDFLDNATSSTITAGQTTLSFQVGATLTVGLTQTAGRYEGTFDVSVNYN